MASGIVACAFKLTKDTLVENINKNVNQRTIYATLDSKDRDYRTLMIMQNWRSEFKDLNPQLKDVEAQLMKLIANRDPIELKIKHKYLYKQVLINKAKDS